MSYDKSNIFAKILRGELPCAKTHESAGAMAFKNIQPVAKEHLLVIPKGEYKSFSDFAERASDEEKLAWLALVAEAASSLPEGGFRIVVNEGPNAGQTIPHLHAHILGGQKMAVDGL
jgi:diadenosine tetraphosphate (Ap4A) HIT family hydrolase